MVGSEYDDVHYAFSNSEGRLNDAEDLPWAFLAAHIVILHLREFLKISTCLRGIYEGLKQNIFLIVQCFGNK